MTRAARQASTRRAMCSSSSRRNSAGSKKRVSPISAKSGRRPAAVVDNAAVEHPVPEERGLTVGQRAEEEVDREQRAQGGLEADLLGDFPDGSVFGMLAGAEAAAGDFPELVAVGGVHQQDTALLVTNDHSGSGRRDTVPTHPATPTTSATTVRTVTKLTWSQHKQEIPRHATPSVPGHRTHHDTTKQPIRPSALPDVRMPSPSSNRQAVLKHVLSRGITYR